MKEFAETLKANWLVLLIAVIAFGFLAWFYPHSDMAKSYSKTMENANRANAMFKRQFNTMTEEDRQWYYNKYGWTEKDYDIMGYINETLD